MKEINENALKDILSALVNSFEDEREKEEPYKELFKSGSSLTGLLRTLDHQMTTSVLDAQLVAEKKLGIKLNRVQFNMLLALPLLAQIAEKDARKHEGMACCVDKAFFILSEQFLKQSD